MPDARGTGPQSRPRRIFFAFLLASAAVHAAALVALSPLTPDTGPSRPGTLEVVILAPKPLPPGAGALPAAPRASGGSQPLAARAATHNTPETEFSAPIGSFLEPNPDERPAIPWAGEVPSASAAKASQYESRQATAAVAAPSFSASYLSNPAPRYPDAARRSGEQGTVLLRVQVARDGAPSRVAVEKSSGSPHLDAAALEAVKAWRFTPARRGADAVESWMLVPIVFRLEQAP